MIACPNCGSTDIAFDWDIVATARFKDGVLEYVNIGGFGESLPDRIVCGNCDREYIDLNPTAQIHHWEETPEELRHKGLLVARAAMDQIPERLLDENLLYEAPSSRPTR